MSNISPERASLKLEGQSGESSIQTLLTIDAGSPVGLVRRLQVPSLCPTHPCVYPARPSLCPTHPCVCPARPPLCLTHPCVYPARLYDVSNTHRRVVDSSFNRVHSSFNLQSRCVSHEPGVGVRCNLLHTRWCGLITDHFFSRGLITHCIC